MADFNPLELIKRPVLAIGGLTLTVGGLLALAAAVYVLFLRRR